LAIRSQSAKCRLNVGNRCVVAEAVKSRSAYGSIPYLDLVGLVVIRAGVSPASDAAFPPENIRQVAIVLLDFDRARLHAPDDSAEKSKGDRSYISGVVRSAPHDSLCVRMKSLNVVSWDRH
jgi:hypothetical protein